MLNCRHTSLFKPQKNKSQLYANLMVGFGIKDSSLTLNEGDRKKGKRQKKKKWLKNNKL